MKIFTKCILVALSFFFMTDIGLSSNQEKEIQTLSKLNLQELTTRSMALVAKKYPGETWKKYNFPKFVYISESVRVGYEIAVKDPRLLAHFRCYCFCEEMGHKNLSYCFFKGGTLGNFDNHAANCNVCVAQTMHAFLFNEMGVPVDRIKIEMKKIYAGH